MGFAGRHRSVAAHIAALCGLGFASLAFSSTPAAADFRVCNATQALIGVAIGYRAADGWKTEGWWNIEASTCQTLIQGALASRFYYLYAEDSERGGRWDGPINMCIADRPFKIDGVADCFQRGFLRAGFREYDTGTQASWMVQLTDEPAEGPVTPVPATPGQDDGADNTEADPPAEAGQ